jgi:hypothetical protein
MNLFQIYIKNKFSSTKEFARGMNMSFPTALRYLRNPKELSVGDAMKIAELTGDSLKHVVECMTWEQETKTNLKKAYDKSISNS